MTLESYLLHVPRQYDSRVINYYTALITLWTWYDKTLVHDLICSDFLPKPWSSLDKEESLAGQITSSFNNKLGCIQDKIEKIASQNNLSFVEWGSYQASQ